MESTYQFPKTPYLMCFGKYCSDLIVSNQVEADFDTSSPSPQVLNAGCVSVQGHCKLLLKAGIKWLLVGCNQLIIVGINAENEYVNLQKNGWYALDIMDRIVGAYL